jgi:hypothetical protein
VAPSILNDNSKSFTFDGKFSLKIVGKRLF